MSELPTPQLTTHANGPHYVATWDPVLLLRPTGPADLCSTTNDVSIYMEAVKETTTV